MSFLGRKGFTLLPSPNAISPSGSVHDKLELELEIIGVLKPNNKHVRKYKSTVAKYLYRDTVWAR